jgi:hypothetical protein
MSLNLNSKPGSDLEGSARESAELKFERVPQVKIHAMPAMSDNELYFRLNVPDGLETNGTWPQKIDYSAQDEAAHGQTSIKQKPDYSGWRMNWTDSD